LLEPKFIAEAKLIIAANWELLSMLFKSESLIPEATNANVDLLPFINKLLIPVFDI
jgi:hypothetical protein